MDPELYAKQRIKQTKPAMEWQKQAPGEMLDWQFRVRGELRRLLGDTHWERCPLEDRVLETRQFPGYRRETIHFRSRPGMEVLGYFLTPDGYSTRGPAVLCLPGHGRGVDSIVGIAEDGSQRELGSPGEYQADFALQCVEHGYPTFAIEQVSFGHRRDRRAQEASADASSCSRDSTAALMLGETITGWRVWDAIRALDYMSKRPEVDPRQMITMGISGGGLTSLWTACLDRRAAAAVVSGYFNTFQDSILSIDHCVDNYVPGVLNVIEMPDMAALVAPRALFVESGSQDSIFPLAAFEQAAERAREIYTAFGVPERFNMEVFEGDHRFHGKGAFEFLEGLRR